jgi:hypothetical protein
MAVRLKSDYRSPFHDTFTERLCLTVRAMRVYVHMYEVSFITYILTMTVKYGIYC